MQLPTQLGGGCLVEGNTGGEEVQGTHTGMHARPRVGKILIIPNSKRAYTTRPPPPSWLSLALQEPPTGTPRSMVPRPNRPAAGRLQTKEASPLLDCRLSTPPPHTHAHARHMCSKNIELRDALCSCEAYGMRPMYKKNKRKKGFIRATTSHRPGRTTIQRYASRHQQDSSVTLAPSPYLLEQHLHLAAKQQDAQGLP